MIHETDEAWRDSPPPRGPWNCYRDTYKRWGRDGRDSFRSIITWQDSSWSGKIIRKELGPRSPTQKLHGRWLVIESDPYERKDEWYWYGELITEGEWHLRNK